MKNILRLPFSGLFASAGNASVKSGLDSSAPRRTAADARFVMSPCLALPQDRSVAQAFERLRLAARDKAPLHRLYVTDAQGRLAGAVTLRRLLLARPDAPLRSIMEEHPFRCAVDDDLTRVADILRRADLPDIPVVAGTGAPVGVVDRNALPARPPLTGEQGYLGTSTWDHFRNRVGWIVVLAVMGLASGLIIHSYEDALSSMLLLALYMPMVADTGGNTGSQSATVIIRALALGEVGFADVWRVLLKELRVSFLIAAVLGCLAWGKVLFLSGAADMPHGIALIHVGCVIGLALGLQVVSSTLIGALLPLAAARLGLDPAVVASPMLTTVVDITGLLIYFGTASALLGL